MLDKYRLSAEAQQALRKRLHFLYEGVYNSAYPNISLPLLNLAFTNSMEQFWDERPDGTLLSRQPTPREMFELANLTPLLKQLHRQQSQSDA